MKKATKFEVNFQEIRNQFDKAGGILEPIRCLVHRVEDEKDIFAEIAKASAEGASCFCCYKNHSYTVGYFAAIKDEKGEVHIGISICDPSDFDKKDNRISQLTAIRSAKKFDEQNPMSLVTLSNQKIYDQFIEECVNKMWLTPSHNGYFNRVIRYSHIMQGNVFYNFSVFTLADQFAYFIERCQRYFYPELQPKEAEKKD